MSDPADEAWVRSTRAAVVEHGEALLLVDRAGGIRALTGDDAELAREVLTCLDRPRSFAAVLAHVETTAGAPLSEAQRAVVADVVALLADTGAIDRALPQATTAPRGYNIVVAASGALAATHVPVLVSALLAAGHTV